MQFTCPNGFSVSRGEKHAYNLEDLVSLIPKEAVVRKTSRGYEGHSFFSHKLQVPKLRPFEEIANKGGNEAVRDILKFGRFFSGFLSQIGRLAIKNNICS